MWVFLNLYTQLFGSKMLRNLTRDHTDRVSVKLPCSLAFDVDLFC